MYDLPMRILSTIAFLLLATVAVAQESAQALVDRAIRHSGGWAAWSATRSVQFRKTIVRYAPDGTVKDRYVQLHRYLLNPSPRMRIESVDKGAKVVLINDGHQAWKLVDGKLATSSSDVNSARNSTFGSHYVFSMPFKLRDPGVQVSDGGAVELPGGVAARKLKVEYPKGVGDAGGLHEWTYFFNPENGRLVANHLHYAPGKYDWTEYFDEKTFGGLTLSTRREGYDADANGRTGPKQSEITYDQIETNVELSPELFQPPK